jgi:hypothetical protein
MQRTEDRGDVVLSSSFLCCGRKWGKYPKTHALEILNLCRKADENISETKVL